MMRVILAFGLAGVAFGSGDEGALTPCVDVEENVCASFCQVDGECCPSDHLYMNSDFSWSCCEGVVSQEGGQTCTKAEEPELTPCVDVEENVCASFCQVDGACCPSDHLYMNSDFSWSCCEGVVTQEGGQTCTFAPKMEDCTDVESDVCESLCQADGECCPSDHLYMNPDFTFKCCEGVVTNDDGQKCTYAVDCSDITDPCLCTGECGWSSTNNACESSADSQTECGECPTMEGCIDTDCAASPGCPMEYDPMRVCQCTENCGEFGNCCADAADCVGMRCVGELSMFEERCNPIKNKEACEEEGKRPFPPSDGVCDWVQTFACFSSKADATMTENLDCMNKEVCDGACEYIMKVKCGDFTRKKDCNMKECTWSGGLGACLEPSCEYTDRGADVANKNKCESRDSCMWFKADNSASFETAECKLISDVSCTDYTQRAACIGSSLQNCVWKKPGQGLAKACVELDQ